MCVYVCVCMYAYIHIYTCIHIMEHFAAIKKNEILTFAMTWMELVCILSKISQAEKFYF